jgi:hypothetical protein
MSKTWSAIANRLLLDIGRPIEPHSMKTLLKTTMTKGLADGWLLDDDSLPMNRASVITALVQVGGRAGIRDTAIFSRLLDRVGPVTADDIGESVDLLEAFSHYGLGDERIVVTSLAGILEKGVNKLIPGDCARVLRIMDRQGFVHSELAQLLVSTLFDNAGDHSEIADAMVSLSNMKLPLEARFRTAAKSMESIKDCINVAWAIVLNPDLMGDSEVVGNILIPTLERVTTDYARLTEYLKGSPTGNVKLQSIRMALIHAHPGIYPSLGPITRSSLARLSSIPCSPMNPHRKSELSNGMVGSLSRTLFRAKFAHDIRVSSGVMPVDILERDARVAWFCNSRARFLTHSGVLSVRPFHILKERIMSCMGYSVVSVPYWQWESVRNRKSRLDYCLSSRYAANSGSPHAAFEGGRPDSFDAKTMSVPSTRSQVYAGESFLKKSRPKNSWAWHGGGTVVDSTRISI